MVKSAINVADYLGLAISLARGASMPPQFRDDAMGDAALGLCQAARTFRPSRANFATHARSRIIGAICDGLRHSDGLRPRPHGARFAERPRFEALSDLLAVADDPAAPRESEERGELLESAVAGLPERERIVIRGIFLEGATYRAVGARLGVTASYVEQIRARAIWRLRCRLSVHRQFLVERAA